MRQNEVDTLLEQGTEPLLTAIRSAKVRMSYQRALRCVKDGVGGVRLPAIRIGGRWHTSPEAVREFIAQTTRGALQRTAATAPPPATGTGARYLRALGLDRMTLENRKSSPDPLHSPEQPSQEGDSTT